MICRECPHARTIPYPTAGGAIYLCTVGGCNVGIPETDPWPWDEDNDKKEVSD